VYALAFTPDGNRLISGSFDTTALVWDVSDLMPRVQPPEKEVSAEEWNELWSRLGDDDASRAYVAIQAVRASPKQAVSSIDKRLKAATAADSKAITNLIAERDSDEFAVRKKAGKELEKLGERAAPALRKALEGEPTPEARKRLEDVLAKITDKPPAGEALRSLRAV